MLYRVGSGQGRVVMQVPKQRQVPVNRLFERRWPARQRRTRRLSLCREQHADQGQRNAANLIRLLARLARLESLDRR